MERFIKFNEVGQQNELSLVEIQEDHTVVTQPAIFRRTDPDLGDPCINGVVINPRLEVSRI